jgi:hypoxanthine phosphoribosyltransferase
MVSYRLGRHGFAAEEAMEREQTQVLFSEETIRKRVGELAHQISSDYSREGELLLVGILRGCYIFLADLSRRLTVPGRIDFVALSSYESGTTAEGKVRLVMDLRTDIAGKHVLIVEDIVDTGATLDCLLSVLRKRKPASLKTCAFLRKQSRLVKELPVDYVGFDIPDVWVVGYGLDYMGRYRALSDIGIIAIPPAAR